MTAPSTQIVKYAEVKAGDLVWNAYGYCGKAGHWARVTEIKQDGPVVILSVSDGYKQYGAAREGIAVKR